MAYDRTKSMISPGVTTKWDLESGICPWGHPIEACKNPNSVRNRCRFNERAKARANGGKPHQRAALVMTKKVKVMVRQGATMKYVGSKCEPDFMRTRIVLVCGHDSYYKKYAVDQKYYDDPLYCSTHHDWFKIHEVHDFEANDYALLVYPLESESKVGV